MNFSLMSVEFFTLSVGAAVLFAGLGAQYVKSRSSL